MNTRKHITIFTSLLAACLLSLPSAFAEDPLADITVIYKKGTKIHLPNCSRVKDKGSFTQMTLAEAEIKGGDFTCGKCRNVVMRQHNIDIYERERTPVEFDPDTVVYRDALFMRVHAGDCSALLMKDKKETMTLAQADKEGWHIGKTGQSGRGNCCFIGYKRQHPEKPVGDDTMIIGRREPGRWKHVPGCHRMWPASDMIVMPKKDWNAEGYSVCNHCKARGPGIATVDEEKLKAMNGKVGIYELPFEDPKASAEHMMFMRFFFPNGTWLENYHNYRTTGDQAHLDLLREAARYYAKMSTDFPSVAERKAGNPEGAAYTLATGLWPRITLQNARKSPGSVSDAEIAEAEQILGTMHSALWPSYGGNENLDPEMGIPQDTANNFRKWQANRAINGIATIGMMSAALKDLQAVKNTTKYQSLIDHYDNKVIGNWMEAFKDSGYTCKKTNAFYYPYLPEGNDHKTVDGCKILGRPEDNSHWRFTVTGLTMLFDTGHVDEAFMMQVANSVHSGLAKRQGAFTCPCVPGKKVKEFRGESEEYIPLNAFKEGTSKGRGRSTERWSNFADYLKALREDPTLIHL